MWHTALPLEVCQILHGFSDHCIGVSKPPFDSLNFYNRQDNPADVAENRRTTLAELLGALEQPVTPQQIHSVQVCEAVVGQIGAVLDL